MSEYYAEFMPGYLGIPPEKIRVVPLGINLQVMKDRERGRRREPFTVGFFARIAPEKGLHVLAEAYQKLRERWSYSCRPGWKSLAIWRRNTRIICSDIEQAMKDGGLGDRVSLSRRARSRAEDRVPAKARCAFGSGDLRRAKGIFLLEAMACGVPVVQPRRGAFTEIVEKTGGGLLVEPDDQDKSGREAFCELYREPASGEKARAKAVLKKFANITAWRDGRPRAGSL